MLRPGLLIIIASIGLSAVVDAGEQTYRVVSYNIKHGRGNDGHVDLNRTAGVLKALDPDFVGLQEVDDKVKRSGEVDQMAALALKLEMSPAFGAFMAFQGGRYGLGLLSKHPIRKTKSIRLPDGNEPRVALVAEVELPNHQRITLINVHFDWVRDDTFRFAQATAVKSYLDTLKTPYILMGDFNDERNSRTLDLLSQSCVDAIKPKADRFTFSSDRPKSEIDFLFASPQSRWTVGQVRVIHEPLASDHRPVLAEFTLSADR